MTPDCHGTCGRDHGAWLGLDDGFSELPCKEVGEKEMGLFQSGRRSHLEMAFTLMQSRGKSQED